MKFTIEIDPEVNPDAVGEYLRSAFFDEKEIYVGSRHAHRETGGYSTFDWQKDVEPLEDLHQEAVTCPGCQNTEFSTQGAVRLHEYICACIDEARWTRGKKRFQYPTEAGLSDPINIECRYYWDGDGILVFILPDGKCLVNPDCKKDHDWYLTDSLGDV